MIAKEAVTEHHVTFDHLMLGRRCLDEHGVSDGVGVDRLRQRSRLGLGLGSKSGLRHRGRRGLRCRCGLLWSWALGRTGSWSSAVDLVLKHFSSFRHVHERLAVRFVGADETNVSLCSTWRTLRHVCQSAAVAVLKHL